VLGRFVGRKKGQLSADDLGIEENGRDRDPVPPSWLYFLPFPTALTPQQAGGCCLGERPWAFTISPNERD
jgi:hypothetical protein